MRRRHFIEFTNEAGETVGRVELIQSSSRGNKHFNPRRPDGPVCGAMNERREGGRVVVSQCMQPWQPLCPDYKCAAAQAVRRIERAERQHGSKFGQGGKRFVERQAA